jgi:TetR/AcrR family transcriptional repressor of nem operon
METEAPLSTREAIMAAATNTVMTEGYNALSFRDLAADVGIKSASVHHHFPTKGDLAEAIVGRFGEDFTKRMEPLLDLPFEEALDGYIGLFRSAFVDSNRMCLGGMMSAEVSALPEPARAQLKGFVEAHKDFVRAVLLKKHKRMASEKLEGRVFAIFAAMEGAQLIARGLGGDAAVFDGIVESYKASGLLA